MTDRISILERSNTMRKIKSKNTSLEKKVRSELYKKGLRYRINHKIYGNPDIVFIGPKVAVFIDSCFWHGCGTHCRMPGSNQEYWTEKIARNIKRDMIVTEKLTSEGWFVIRLWEHEIKANLVNAIDTIKHSIESRRKKRARDY